jgi:hypothetical protein
MGAAMLVLRLRPGEDFYVAEERVVVGELLGGPRFLLHVESTGRRYAISDEESTEMREVADVFLTSGGRAHAGLARVAIDAPREISIVRGAVMRGESGGGDAFTPPQIRLEKVDPGRRYADKQPSGAGRKRWA